MVSTLIFLFLLLASLGVLGLGALLTVRAIVGDETLKRRLARAAPGAAVEEVADDGRSRLAHLLDRRAPWLTQRLLSAGAPMTAEHVALGALGLTGVILVAGMIAGLSFLLTLGLALWGGLAGPYMLIAWMAARRRKQFLEQMPQAVDLIARSLQAGHPVTTAIGVVAKQMPEPIGPEFAKTIAEMRHGLDRDRALRNLLQRFPIAELRMFAASLEVTRETGGNLAEVFLNLADTIRSKGQLRKRVMAISAEGRLTFWVVSALPILVAAAIAMLNPDYYKSVSSDPLFWPLMSVPPTLWGIGSLMLWRMINFRI